jgi:WD40-like Beta Propeller Repeat
LLIAPNELSKTKLAAALERLEASFTFERSLGLIRLLGFLLDAAESSPQSLKETYIGMVFYKRDASYDPRLDSIVRVNTRRLRQRLEEYYAREGAAEGVRITVPVGTYVPVVTQELSPESPEPGSVISEGVDEPLQLQSDEQFVERRLVKLRSARHTVAWVSAAFVLLVCVSAIILVIRRSLSEPGFVTGSFEKVPVTMGLDIEFEPATSPDGRQLAYVSRARGSSQFQIFLRAFLSNGSEARVLQTGTENALYPIWSPDGSQIAFLRCGRGSCDIATVPSAGGVVRGGSPCQPIPCRMTSPTINTVSSTRFGQRMAKD